MINDWIMHYCITIDEKAYKQYIVISNYKPNHKYAYKYESY